MTWIDVDYWAVFDKSDTELFRGSKTACRKYARQHHLTVSHVILERID